MATNILVVDDSATMRRMIRRSIELSGLDVGEIHEAANGIEALACMSDHAIGAVLLDINMPVMDGRTFIDRMRDDPRLKDTPVLICSAEGSQARIAELLSAGARVFIRKPFHPEQIRDALLAFVPMRRSTVTSERSSNSDRAF